MSTPEHVLKLATIALRQKPTDDPLGDLRALEAYVCASYLEVKEPGEAERQRYIVYLQTIDGMAAQMGLNAFSEHANLNAGYAKMASLEPSQFEGWRLKLSKLRDRLWDAAFAEAEAA